MDKVEVFQILGIAATKDTRSIKNAYREKLTVTNPEDDPEGFKRLRAAYEEACRLARQTGDEAEKDAKDETPSGIWVEKAAEIYRNIRRRRDPEQWKKLFNEDCFLSLEEEENCRFKLLRFLMEHFRLPGDVWKLLDKKLCITSDTASLRERFPADFVRYILNKCGRGEEVEFDQFEGGEEAPYDLFLQYYDSCWQALQNGDLELVRQNIDNADGLNIRHPVMEVCRAELLEKQGNAEKAIALLQRQMDKYPGDALIGYNMAEMLWRLGTEPDGDPRRRAAEIYKSLKEDNDAHYMANMRLTEWYYDNGRYKEAKKCAEKVLSVGSGDEFMELLRKVNEELEKDLRDGWYRDGSSEAALELCWCYLQDGKISQGIRLAQDIEKRLPPGKTAEWTGLMTKLYVEEAEYEDSVAMTFVWEEKLNEKISADESEEEREKDRDRLLQARVIRMQCYHNLGFREETKFADAIREGESVLEGSAKDIGILLEMAQIYNEMGEYEKCEEIVAALVEDHQVFAAYAASMESYRRQLNPGGVVRTGGLCIQYFPTYAKSYEYVAKVYLDLEQPKELEKVLEDAEKNGVKSDVLEAYRYQKNHSPMELDTLNQKLRSFRTEFRKPVGEGHLSFYEAGLARLTEYLYNCPDSYMFVERGIFHRAAHHYREAREDFEKALTLNPSNPYALNGLSFVYRYMGDYEKALFYIKKAILYMDEEMSPAIYTDMADLYSLLGDYERALAGCRRYLEVVEEQNIWSLNKLAEIHANLGNTKDACALYGNVRNRKDPEDKWIGYEESTRGLIQCGDAAGTKAQLAEWLEGLNAETNLKTHFFGKLVWRMKASPEQNREYARYCSRALWAELVFGEKKAAEEYIAGLLFLTDQAGNTESGLADAVFACIVCGLDRQGKKCGERLAKRLQSNTPAEKASKYFNREKKGLQMEALAAWYFRGEDGIQAILDREPDCGICHFCVSPFCSRVEAVRILLLVRQERHQEARQRLLHNMEIRPADQYMLALRHTVFGMPDSGDVG